MNNSGAKMATETALRRIGPGLAIVGAIALWTAGGPASAQQACPEAGIGQCFAQYSEITAVAAVSDGFAAIGVAPYGVSLMRLGPDGEILYEMPVPPPDWLAADASAVPRIDKAVPAPDGSVLLVGSVGLGPASDRRQVGLIATVDPDGAVSWGPAVQVSNQTSVILYSAAYDAQADRFVVVGRHTNGSDNGRCEFWSQGFFISVPASGFGVPLPVFFSGEAAPGFGNRTAIYDIAPAGEPSSFVVTGFTTAPNADGTGCQDNAVAMSLSGGAAGDWNLSAPNFIGTVDANELGFGVAAAGSGRFLLAGYGTDVAIGARAALMARFGFDGSPPEIRTDPVPEDGSDASGGDRYRLLLPLKGGGSYLAAGSASIGRQGRNQGFWRIFDGTLQALGPAAFLTSDTGSDILAAALAPDGRVLAAGSHHDGDATIGWLGFIHDNTFSAERRLPDMELPSLTREEVARGFATYSERELAAGASYSHANMKAGAEFELNLSFREEVELAVSTLTAEGDLDLALVDPSGGLMAFSSNLGDAGEYLHARLQPGDYVLKVIAVSDIVDYELRAVTGVSVAERVLASLHALDAGSRQSLGELLSSGGYVDPANPDIGFGGDTVRSVLAMLNTYRIDPQAESVEQFIAAASAGGSLE